MIVQCPSCAARYRVNDANIPATGGKIRCPSCSHAFVVYPEAASGPAMHDSPQEKTSIAERPNLNELLSSMKRRDAGAAGGPNPGAEEDDDDIAKTEIMSGAELPDFDDLFGGDPPPADATMEMANPFYQQDRREAAPSVVEDELQTQELNSDIVKASLEQIQRQAQQSPPIVEPEDEEPSTQITPPPFGDRLPQAQGQRRISAPSGPTPPPAGAASFQGVPPRFDTTPPPPQEYGSGPVPGFGSTPAPAGGDAAANREHDGPWKLQTNFGLTYEFVDNQSLRNWLESRDDLDGYKLSVDGKSFLPLSAFPQVQKTAAPRHSGANQSLSSMASQPSASGDRFASPAASGPQSIPSGPGPSFGSGPVPGSGPIAGPGSEQGVGAAPTRSPFTTANAAVKGPGSSAPAGKEKINPNEAYRPPTRDSQALNLLLWGAFGLLVVVALVVAAYLLDEMGVIDIFGGEEPVARQVEPPVSPGLDEVAAPAQEPPLDEEAEAAARTRNNQQVNRLLDDARVEMESNRLTSAMDRLDSAELVDPERIQIYEMKAEVHEKLGDSDQADEMRQRAQQLRDEAAGSLPPESPTQ